MIKYKIQCIIIIIIVTYTGCFFGLYRPNTNQSIKNNNNYQVKDNISEVTKLKVIWMELDKHLVITFNIETYKRNELYFNLYYSRSSETNLTNFFKDYKLNINKLYSGTMSSIVQSIKIYRSNSLIQMSKGSSYTKDIGKIILQDNRVHYYNSSITNKKKKYKLSFNIKLNDIYKKHQDNIKEDDTIYFAATTSNKMNSFGRIESNLSKIYTMNK